MDAKEQIMIILEAGVSIDLVYNHKEVDRKMEHWISGTGRSFDGNDIKDAVDAGLLKVTRKVRLLHGKPRVTKQAEVTKKGLKKMAKMVAFWKEGS